MLSSQELFDFDRIPDFLRPLFEVEKPWDTLAKLDALMASIEDKREGTIHPSAVLDGKVWLEEGASIGPHAFIQGPAYIAAGASIGHAAYVRGGVVLLAQSRVGHATEIKRSILLEGAKAPHFNYVGDSIMGHDVNIGAGVKLANFHALGKGIKVGAADTGLRKFGAALGDGVSIGCNAVLAPGTLVGKNTMIYATASVTNVIPDHSFVKLKQNLKISERH